MARDPQTVFDEALSLPEADRSRLIELLLDSIHGPTDPEIDAELADEAQRRLAEFEKDRSQGVPAEEAFKRAREALARFRASS
jgi:putative addiction module component (TIGR02574 family)